MAQSSISISHDLFICPICLNLLKDPVTVPCGHCFCKVCVNGYWDQKSNDEVYSCPQCRDTFTPRPVLRRNNMLAEVVEKLKQKIIQEEEEEEEEVQAASPAHCYSGPEDVAKQLLEQLEQEIADLQRRLTELEQLSHTHDHIQFLQSLQSHCGSSGHGDSPSTTVNQHLSFNGVRKSLSDLKKTLEEEFIKIPQRAAAAQMIFPTEPQSREDFLHYFCDLTLDPNTVNYNLILSDENRVVTCSKKDQPYSDHPQRFDYCNQVMSKESVSGRCYWEVEWSGKGYVYISVSYKDISRKGWWDDCCFGYNNQSWSLQCTSSLCFYHNDNNTDLRPSFRIGVYVDHSAGTLSFYSISHTLKLLHRVHTTFTRPLYAGFNLPYYGSTVRLCDPK